MAEDKESQGQESGLSFLMDRLKRMDAVYHRFGRDGLKDYPISDVALLLSSKELHFRDLPKGPGVRESDREAARMLELEIKDLNGYVNAQMATLGGQGMRLIRQLTVGQQSVEQKPAQKYPRKDFERDR